MEWHVYVLKDPRTDEVRYVGWTSILLSKRLCHHISTAKRKRRTHKDRWVLSLISSGVIPVIESIEKGSGDGWAAAEIKWIKWHKDASSRLVNATDGGEGFLLLSAEKLSERSRNREANRSPEERLVIAQKARERVLGMSPERMAERERKRLAALSHEQRVEIAKRSRATMTAQARSDAVRKQWAGMTAEQRRDSVRLRQQSITPEQRSAAAKKRRARGRQKAR